MATKNQFTCHEYTHPDRNHYLDQVERDAFEKFIIEKFCFGTRPPRSHPRETDETP